MTGLTQRRLDKLSTYYNQVYLNNQLNQLNKTTVYNIYLISVCKPIKKTHILSSSDIEPTYCFDSEICQDKL